MLLVAFEAVALDLFELVAGLDGGGGGAAGLLRATRGLAGGAFLRRTGGAPGGRLAPLGKPFGGALMADSRSCYRTINWRWHDGCVIVVTNGWSRKISGNEAMTVSNAR